MNRNIINLDHAATTPLDPKILEMMIPLMGEDFGNPSGAHQLARKSAVTITKARRKIASLFVCKPSEILFTSGGTESNNLALRGAAFANKSKGLHLISSEMEHPSVLKTLKDLEANFGFELTLLPASSDGTLSILDLHKAIRKDTILASFMLVNNETGILQDIQSFGEVCRKNGTLLHCDASQAVNTIKIQPEMLNVDLLTISSHKFYGPKGIGLLYQKEDVSITSQQTGGSQEQAKRAGTENIASIFGITEALGQAQESVRLNREDYEALHLYLKKELQKHFPSICYLPETAPVEPHILTFFVPDIKADDILMRLDLKGICASSGSACSSGNAEPSKVLLALGIDAELALGAIRFSFGKTTSMLQLKTVVTALQDILEAK